MKNILSPLLFVSLLAACAGAGRLQPDASPPTADEAFVIVGVKPAIATVVFYPSEIENGVVSALLSRLPSIADKPIDGYVIAKTDAGDVLQLSNVNWDEPNQRRVIAPACGNSQVMVFKTVAGKVIYPGDIIVTKTGQSLSFRTEFNPEAAKAALAVRFPKLKDYFVAGEHTLLPTSRKCPTSAATMPQPIFIYKSK